MLDTVVNLLRIAFTACVGWFEQIMQKTGMLPFYLGGLFIFFSVGFLLTPLRNGLPGGLSDSAADAHDAHWTKVTKGSGKYASGKWTSGRSLYNRVGKGHFEK